MTNNNRARDRFTLMLDTVKDKFLSRFVPYITLFIVIISFTYIYTTSFIEIKEDKLPIIQSIIEFIKTITIMAVSFWVGSSVASKIKDKSETDFSDDDIDIEYTDSNVEYNIDDKDINIDNIEYNDDKSNIYSTILNKYNSDKFLIRFVPYLSILIFILGFGYLFAISFIDIGNKYIILSSIEYMKTLLTMVLSFWVGSSVGSKLKDKE